MPDSKISDLTALTGADVASMDALPIVDTSATTTKKITAEEMRKYMRGRRGARVSRATNQTIASNTAVATIFTAEQYDTDACADLGAQSTRLTVPTGFTLIRLYGHTKFTAILSNVYIYTRKNGGALSYTDGAMEQSGLSALGLSATSGIMSVVAGDYFELMNWNTGGGTLAGAWFEMELLG